jgi:predicted RNase H-like HicB family nuclease
MPSSLEDFLALPYRMEITPGDHGGYVVDYPDLLGCVTQVDDLDDAVPMGREVLTGWLEIALEDGAEIPLPRQPHSYSGKFVLRLPKSMHRQLAERAEDEGVSLNQYAVSLLAQGEAFDRIEAQLEGLASQLAAIHDRLQYDFAGVPNNPRKAELRVISNKPIAA